MPGFIGLPEILLLGLRRSDALRPEAAARDGPRPRQGHARVQGLGQRRPPASTASTSTSSSSRRSTDTPPRPSPSGRRDARRGRRTRSPDDAVAPPAAPARPGGRPRRPPGRAPLAAHRRGRSRRRRARRSPTSFHRRIVRWLIRPLPPGHRQLITFGVAEPFTTSLKVSFAAGFALALPIVLWQMWAFFAPALEPATQRGIARLGGFAGGAARRRRRLRLPRRAARGAQVPRQLRPQRLQHPDPRRRLHLVRRARPRRLRRGVRAADRRARSRPRPRALVGEAAAATAASAT